MIGYRGYSSDSADCGAVQIAMQDVLAPSAYPVSCDFVSLSATGTVFFMDPETMLITQGMEVSLDTE